MYSSWIEIDLAQFQKNLSLIKARIGSALLCCVVKANAYGHGLIPIAKEAEASGADYLAVYHVHEGISLRKAGISLPILVLGAFQEAQLEGLISFRLDFVVSSLYKAKLAAQKSYELGLPCFVHIEVDTGMRRTGVRLENAHALIEFVQNRSCFLLKGIFSHFVSSENKEDPTTRFQIEQFLSLKEAVGGDLLWHLANSGGIAFYPESHLSMVRAGAICYGAFVQEEIGVRPILSLKARVAYFKVVAAGEGISYGHLHRTTQQTRIVTVPVGYGDGYRRDFFSKINVLIRGKRYPIIGAVCMDQFMVDIGKGEAYIGDEVVLLGRQGEEEISLFELAKTANADPRELLSQFNERIPKVYTQGD